MDTAFVRRRVRQLLRPTGWGVLAAYFAIALGGNLQAQEGPALTPPAQDEAIPSSPSDKVVVEPPAKKAKPAPKPRRSSCCTVAPAASSCCAVAPAAPAGCLRPYDQVWLISARRASCVPHKGEPRLKYWQLDASGRWTPSARELFLATDEPSVPTTFWIHGNRISSGEATSIGMTVYRQLVRADQRPLRFVIWSWPSDRIKGIFKDVRIKAARANHHGYYLGWLLNDIQPECRVSVIGYSYGARIAAGGLHLIGGGRVSGRKLAHRRHPDRVPMRAVFMASAADSDSLLPGHLHGLALSQVDQVLLLNNPCDWVLKKYRMLASYRPVALGRVGMPVYALSKTNRSKIRQVNICAKPHDWSLYVHSSGLMAKARSCIFWNDKLPKHSTVAGRTTKGAAIVATK